MVGVTEDDQRDVPGITACVEINTEEAAPGAARCQLGLYARAIVCVASDGEEESLKVRIRLKLRILRALEWRGACSFCPGVGIECAGAIYSGVVNRDPLDRPGRANRVQKQLVVREHIACRVFHRERNEHDRVAVDRDLERLQFALSQIVRRCGNKTVNERIRISSKLPGNNARGTVLPPTSSIIRTLPRSSGWMPS